MDHVNCKGYDKEGWRVLGTQLRDGEATKIKVRSRTDVSALGMTVITERNSRLAAMAAASADVLAAVTSTMSRKRRVGDKGQGVPKQARGSKRREKEKDEQARAPRTPIS